MSISLSKIAGGFRIEVYDADGGHLACVTDQEAVELRDLLIAELGTKDKMIK